MDRNSIARIKNHYKQGMRLELIRMDDPYSPVEAGTRGTVEYVDDEGNIGMKWDNGRSLSIIPGLDQFRLLTPEECYDEKCEHWHNVFIDRVNRNVIPDIDWGKLQNSYRQNNTEYPSELLKRLHDTFTDVYGTDSLNSAMEFVSVPGVVLANDGKPYVALLELDLSSSGEHWGTTFITPRGILDFDSGDSEVRNYLKTLSPYSYWYTPVYDGDIHTDFANCPDEIKGMISKCNGESLTEDSGMMLS